MKNRTQNRKKNSKKAGSQPMMDMDQDDMSFMDQSNPSLHLSDLDIETISTGDSSLGNTTMEESSQQTFLPPIHNAFNGDHHDFDSFHNNSLHLSDLEEEEDENTTSTGNTTIETNFTQGGSSFTQGGSSFTQGGSSDSTKKRKSRRTIRKTQKKKHGKPLRKTQKKKHGKPLRKTNKKKHGGKTQRKPQKGGQYTSTSSLSTSIAQSEKQILPKDENPAF